MTAAPIGYAGETGWEKVDASDVMRLRVPGGWLYRWRPSFREPCMAFVPALAADWRSVVEEMRQQTRRRVHPAMTHSEYFEGCVDAMFETVAKRLFDPEAT